MRGIVLLGVLLLVGGLIALAEPVIRYTRTEKVIDAGPIEVTAERDRRLVVPPVLAGLTAVAGLIVIITSARKA
jgi:hypothetical protein